VLVLTTARKPELVDAPMARRTLEELGRELHATSLELAPLSRLDTTLLVRSRWHVTSDAAALTRLEEQVWAVSEGNPFVAVETIRALHEGSLVEGSTTMPLPKRVRDLTADRLGRLSDRGRLLAAVAAVIGREFDFALLQRASGCDEAAAAEGVEELVRRGVLEGMDDRFDFTHDRIRAVISAELLLPQRKLLHRQIGAALEALHADDLETHSFALGTHFRAGEVWDKAVAYLHQAGVRALARSANREAVTCFEEALTALGHLPETPETLEQGIDLRFDLRTSLFPLGEFGRIFGCLSEAEGLAKALDDQRRLGQLSVYLCHNLHMTGDDTKAYGFGQRARALAESLGDVQLLVTGTLYLSAACAGIGDYRQAEEILLKVLQLLHGDLSSRLSLCRQGRTQPRCPPARTRGGAGPRVEPDHSFFGEHGDPGLRLRALGAKRRGHPVAGRRIECH
jgi:tetratricopeptide (TPR) repeat protein